MQGRVAYILKAFGRTSETFITNEIDLLGRLGMNLTIFSLKSLKSEQRHSALDRILAPVTWLPEAEELTGAKLLPWMWRNAPKFLGDHRVLLGQRPLSYVATLIEAIRLCVRFRKKVFLREFLQAGTIARAVLNDGQIQHLHAHFCHGSTTVAMFTSRLTGIPFSFTAHAKDIYVEDLNPGDLLQRKMTRAKFIATCTEANKKHLDARRPAAAAPVTTIYHGLDSSLFRPRRGGSPSALPCILSVGRFVEKKGFTTLVEACALLRDRGFAFSCLLVGGADAYLPAVKARIQELHLDEVVTVRGAVTQQQLRDIYDQSTLFALPCQVLDNGDRDGIPNVLAEAMAMQLPVVSTNISGIPELVQSGVNGLLVPPRDAQALADAMGLVLNDAALRTALGARARETILEVFDSTENTQRLAAMFRECMGTPVARPVAAGVTA